MMCQIVVHPKWELQKRRRLFYALGRWLNVKFCTEDELSVEQADGAILFGGSADLSVQNVTRKVLLVLNTPLLPTPHSIRFSRLPNLHFALRGQSLNASTCAVLGADVPGETLAECDNGRVWVRHQQKDGVSEYVGGAPDELAEGSQLSDALAGGNRFGLLPMIDFVRQIGSNGWQEPPLRSCIMFDDPNLHWTSYGFIDFAKMAEHAEKNNYHAAMATVPLDSWFVCDKAARIFRECCSRLSLLVHGNNHTLCELAQRMSKRGRRCLVACSLRRIDRLEKKSGIVVSRIMAAPHGACSEEMCGELLCQGYEAACISRGSLRRHNARKNWPASFGLEPAEFLANGFPVIPRFSLTRDLRADVILAAFLGQAIIPVGHHQDVAGGLGLLEEVSATINSLGAVSWGNMAWIARTNFKQCQCGRTFKVRMYSRYIQVNLPSNIEKVQIELPWPFGLAAPEIIEFRHPGGQWQEAHNNVITLAPADPPVNRLAIRAVLQECGDYQTINTQSFPVWGSVRRFLAESRDRLQPLRSHWNGGFKG